MRNTIAHYLPLTLYMTRALLKKEVAGTVGGLIWWIAEPLFYFGIYYFVFAVVYKKPTEDYANFLLIGLIIWRWFTLSVTQGTNAITSNKRLLRQVDLPKVIFPVQSFIMETFKFSIGFVILFFFLVVTGGVTWNSLIWLPVPFLAAGILFFSITLVMSAIAPIFPDIRNLVKMAMRGLLFLSCVFYAPEHLPAKVRPFFFLNPLVGLIESFRDVLINGRAPHMLHLASAFVFGLGLLVFGIFVHIRLNRVIPRFLG